MNNKQLERFWSKVNVIEDEDSCWEWTASVGSHGYGQLSIDGGPQTTHTLSFKHFHGPIPKGLEVCHSCDNRKCIRPSHLFAGTRKDNVKDMYDKGRASTGEKHSLAMQGKASRGEQHSEIMKRVASRGENHYAWKGGQ